MLISDLADAFLTANQNSYLANTRRAYSYDLGLFARVLPDLSVNEVTVQHLRAFLIATTDLAPSTLARRQATLRSCFGWAFRNELVDADPTGKLEPVKVPQRDPRPLTEDQVEVILGIIPTSEKRNRLFFTLLYETGMRVGEALGLQVQHMNLNDVDGGYLRVIGKGDREQINATTNKVEAYNGFTKWVFFGGEGVITENDPEEQEKRIKYKDLVCNVIAFQNVVDMTYALRELKREGYAVLREDVAALSPYLTRRIKRFGDYYIDLGRAPQPLDSDMSVPV